MTQDHIFIMIIIFILISLQYTLNLILREIRDIRKILLKKEYKEITKESGEFGK